MKLFTDVSHYSKKHREELAEILRPHLSEKSPEDAEREYGAFRREHPIVASEAEADVCVLPMSWNYYYATKSMPRALAFIMAARAAGKKVVAWNKNDFGVRVPAPDVWDIRPSGYRSRRLPNQHANPVFIPDPLVRLSLNGIQIRPKRDRPRIGFCGLAGDTLVQGLLKQARLLAFNAAATLRLMPEEPQDNYPPTKLRMRALSILESSPALDTNFIRRKLYKGGPRTEKDRERLSKEFFDNILDTDYTVCVRGRGNFSVRLYETLSMGRIPVFIDSDCVLPFDRQIDWKEYCVWVDRRELHLLPQKVLEFHARLSDSAFEELQIRCRQLWVDRLTFYGFFAHFHELFEN